MSQAIKLKNAWFGPQRMSSASITGTEALKNQAEGNNACFGVDEAYEEANKRLFESDNLDN